MFIRITSIVFIFSFFSFVILADAEIDQWQDSDKTYSDLIEDGFEVKAYDINTITAENGILLMFFVTVLQKNKEVYECQEYQTLDEIMRTINMSFVCRKLVQPYKMGVGT